MYGRESSGHSSTRATNQPAETTVATRPAPSPDSRVRSGPGRASRYTSPNAGRTSRAWPIFVRKPNPTAAPAATTHQVAARVEAASTARTIA